MFCEKDVFRNFTKFKGKHLCQSLFFNKKKTLAQVFFCEFCEISKNILFYRQALVAASGHYNSFTESQSIWFLRNIFSRCQLCNFAKKLRYGCLTAIMEKLAAFLQILLKFPQIKFRKFHAPQINGLVSI